MGKHRISKDNVYTIFDKIANKIRVYKVSAATKKVLEDLARNTLKALANMYLAKKLNKKSVSKEVTKFTKTVTKEIGKDLKKKYGK